jgi:hypothetical protein
MLTRPPTQGEHVSNITDVEDGNWSTELPVIIIDAATAQRALEEHQERALLQSGLSALFLSGKRAVLLKEDA